MQTENPQPGKQTSENRDPEIKCNVPTAAISFCHRCGFTYANRPTCPRCGYRDCPHCGDG